MSAYISLSWLPGAPRASCSSPDPAKYNNMKKLLSNGHFSSIKIKENVCSASHGTFIFEMIKGSTVTANHNSPLFKILFCS